MIAGWVLSELLGALFIFSATMKFLRPAGFLRRPALVIDPPSKVHAIAPE